MKNYKTNILLIFSIAFFSCKSKGDSDTKTNKAGNNATVVSDTANPTDEKVIYADTIAIDYLKNKKLLDILKSLPESTMSTWTWSRPEREKTVAFIEKNNFIVDTTEMYNTIKYVEPNTIGIQVVDGFWTLSLYKFDENDFFVVTNDMTGDGNDIQTFNYKDNKLTPTKMTNWFREFYVELLLSHSDECINLFEENELTFAYDFSNEHTIEISSILLNKNEHADCFKGNSITYRLNTSKKTFEVARIYWKDDPNK